MEVKRVDERLELVGEISNSTDENRGLPPVYAVLQDANGASLKSWALEVDASVLGPGEKVPFTSDIDSIPDGTANVSVLFTNPEDN